MCWVLNDRCCVLFHYLPVMLLRNWFLNIACQPDSSTQKESLKYFAKVLFLFSKVARIRQKSGVSFPQEKIEYKREQFSEISRGTGREKD